MIRIRDRFRPFSHRAGAMCMIPKSNWAVEAYPTEIRIVREGDVVSLKLDLTGPVQGFTLEQDLERDRVLVFGRAKEGYFQFEIFHEGREIQVLLKRGKSISYHFVNKKGVLEKHQCLKLEVEEAFLPYHTERLSLGVNKKLDWDLVMRRGDVKEILPVLFFLGQKVDPCDEKYSISLDLILKQQFRDILVPLRESKRSLGFPTQEIPSHVPLSSLLRKSYESIRALFIEEGVSILPHLPPEFVSGRMTCIKMKQAIFDLEWTKGKLRKVRIEAISGGILHIQWPKEVDSFRLKHRPQEKGKRVKAEDELILCPGQISYLDKFQK